ncbi:MAG: ABC transporter substrate-binding protein [Chitinophagaceae bacterium]|nr:ABC transporter substrate-binding protein [Chitinophagaceae bacterium]
MPAYTDQTGHTINLSSKPVKIISLVPSQTELLYDLGLDNEVCGITSFCIHPDQWFRHKIRIGGTKKLNLDKIRTLRPDLILANKEENDREQIEALQKEFNVWTSDIHNIPTALDMIRAVGDMTGTSTAAEALAAKIHDAFAAGKPAPIPSAYLIWNEPLMVAGGDTFIHAMMFEAGFSNVFGEKKRYPVISADDIRNSGCRCLLLSSEPFPFTEKHRQSFSELFPGIQVVLADGEMFSWYGSRMQLAPAYFSALRKAIQLNP